MTCFDRITVIVYIEAIDLSYLSNDELADLLYNVNSRSINTFFNQIRRRLSILERPLVSSRKTYINLNIYLVF